ncbi:MAG: hypothetical protein OEQ13_05790 [Acidobacteriota bacterium]|nr:hypothetical protein [Acidobacteriota bacterium]
MFSNMRNLEVLGSLFLFAAVMLVPSAASADTIRATVDGPIVLAEQIFDGGEIQLTTVGNGSLMAVRIDGRQVALVHHQMDGRSDHGDPVLTFERDQHGNFHLIGLRYTGSDRDAARFRFVPLTVATVAKGDRVLPPITATAVARAEHLSR